MANEQFQDYHISEIPQDEQDYRFESTDPETIISLIQELPEGYRMVLNLYVFEGYKHKEIAEILNISESTSKTQLFKARKMLRSELKKNSKDIVPINNG